jgi:hypothetical protein
VRQPLALADLSAHWQLIACTRPSATASARSNVFFPKGHAVFAGGGRRFQVE